MPQQSKLVINYTTSKFSWTFDTELEFLVYELPILTEEKRKCIKKAYTAYSECYSRRKNYCWTKEEHKKLIEAANKFSVNPPKVWNIGLKTKKKIDNQWVVKHHNHVATRVIFERTSTDFTRKDRREERMRIRQIAFE